MPDLFNLSATTPADAMARGSASAHGEVYVDAVMRRGINLRAGFDFRASADGVLGQELSGKVSAGVNARAGIAFQAAIPLDLFQEAGLVARFQAQAAAAAYVGATVSLEFDVFQQRIRALVPAPLDEVELSAGVWGRAAFAAEILGEAVLAGSLSPTAPRGAGFSFSLQYAAGLGYGAGKEFVASIGFPDPRRLLDRLADRMTAIVLREAEAAIAQQPEATREAASTAIAVTRILLPLGTRTAFRLGFQLAQTDSGERRAAAERAVFDAFAQQAQTTLFEALANLAFARLAGLFAPESMLDAILADEQRRGQAQTELENLRQRLVALEQLQPVDAEAWLAGVVAALGPLGRLLEFGVLPVPVTRDIRHAMAMLWSAAVLMERVLAWYDDPARAARALFDSTPVPAPADGGFAATVAETAGRPAGASLRLIDLVTFLLQADAVLDDLRASVPALARALDWTEEVAGSPGGQALQQLLVELAEPDADVVTSVLTRLGAQVGTLMQNEIVPQVLDPIKARHPDNAAMQLLIDELVTPTIVALPAVVLPQLPFLGTEQAALRLREAVSAVLLQSLAEYTIATINVLLAHALTEGERSLRDLAAQIEALGQAWGGFGAIAMAASQAFIPIRVSPTEVRRLLELAADIAQLVNEPQRGVPAMRESIMTVFRTLVRLGFDSAAGRQATLQTLLTSDDPPVRETLDQALAQMRNGSWQVIQLVVPRAIELLALHYLGVIVDVARAIGSGAREVVRAVEQGIALIVAEAGRLAARLVELAARALNLVGQFAGHVRAIAERARTFVAAVIDTVRAFGLRLLEPLLSPLPDWAEDAFRGLYNALFDVARALFTAPLTMLASVAGWIEDICTTAAALSPDSVKQEVRRRITASAALDLHFDLALWIDPPPVGPIDLPPFKVFDLGRITIPAGDVLRAIADVVLGDEVIDQTVNTAVDMQVELRAVRAEEATVRQLQAGVEAQQEAQADAARLAPGTPLVIRITEPAGEAVLEGQARLHVRIDGANRTFVQPTLGVPPRAVVRINGQVYRYDPAHWVERDGGIEFTAVLIPVPERPAVAPELAPAPTVPIQVERLIPVRARFERLGDEVGLAFIVPETVPMRRGATRRDAAAEGRAMTDTMSPDLGVDSAPEPDQPRRSRPRERVQPMRAAAVFGSTTRAARVARRALPVADAGTAVEHVVRSAGGSSFTFRPAPQIMPLEAITLEAEVEASALGIDSSGAPIIGARAGLNVVQVAIADGRTQAEGERVLFFLERAVPRVVIAEVMVNPPGPDLPDESVLISNEGPEDIPLEGWTLRDLAQHVFRFPTFTLRAGRTVRVWTAEGLDDAENLYWGRRAPVWNNRGDSAILSDAAGREIHRFSYVVQGRVR